MDHFRKAYLSKCAALSIDPHHALSEYLIVHPSSPSIPHSERLDTLDLRGQSTTLRDCAALASALSDDTHFTSINLADSFLDDEGCILIAGALKTNATCETLDLRGNSIRADGAVAVGQMLKINDALKTLILEWNCVGIWQAGVRAIADGLAVNERLEDLDLRNNKIGPDGAQTLALSLRNNRSLRRLDLRWNSIGLLGSKSFVDLLLHNTTLEEVQLAGNEVPEDQLRSIAVSLSRNSDRRKSTATTLLQSTAHANHLASLDAAHRSLTDTLRRETVVKDQQLSAVEKEMDRSRSASQILQSRCEMLENEKRRREDEWEETKAALEARVAGLAKEVEREREVKERLRISREKAIGHAKKKELELDAARCEADLRIAGLQREKAVLVEENEKTREKLRTMASGHDDHLKRLHQEMDEKLKTAETARDTYWEKKVRRLEERVRKAEQMSARIEEDADAQKAKHMLEKRNWATQLSEAHALSQSTSDDRWRSMESNLQTLTRSRDTLQSDLVSASQLTQRTLRELDVERERWAVDRASLASELDKASSVTKTTADALKRDLDKARLDVREAETRAEEAKKRLGDVVEDRKREKGERERELERCREDVRERDDRIVRLKEKVEEKEREMREREEEGVALMRDLQQGIATLVSQRTRTHLRGRSSDKVLV
ncbi:hypothetical protein HKX48_001559 [Thoreauomyces humboldtii]|nr:hypothetical protein HKX48_001559 [Thoreauomyces humboldtii]